MRSTYFQIIVLYRNQNAYCLHSKEPFQRNGSFECKQHVFRLRETDENVPNVGLSGAHCMQYLVKEKELTERELVFEGFIK